VADPKSFGDVAVDHGDDFVATVELQRPPHNYFDTALIESLADAFEALDADDRCRAIVLCSQGKNFCAGAQLGGYGDRLSEVTEVKEESEARGASGATRAGDSPGHLYDEAVRLFATCTPVVAAIQGAAIGGGFGLALMPDFRVAAPEARFSANFARLGFHHGFGLSVTLPELVGQQRAMELLYTGRRIHGEEAFEIGLCDRLAPQAELREVAHALAHEIAVSAPLAVRSIRETLRGGLAERIRAATDREKVEQERLQKTNDFREGVRAMSERRTPSFSGT
jgi:enoyl-CoA hydratase/carnithine racemase